MNVAGPPALLVANLHKLNDRDAPGQAPDRLRDKDTADVNRLMQKFPTATIADRPGELRDHPRAGPTTEEAIGYLGTLFAAPRSKGIGMTVSALGAAMSKL